MSEDGNTPIVLLTFANNRDNPLPKLRQERVEILEALKGPVKKDCIFVKTEESASTDRVYDLCTEDKRRIVIIHYAGHADGTQLMLEASDGGAQHANAKGLARLLGNLDALQLVFLNGCATRDQVAGLLEHGVKVVIATAVEVGDDAANLFATQFYKSLGSGDSIEAAFDIARSRHESGQSQHQVESRAISWQGMAAPSLSEGTPWGLYYSPQNQEALAWKLPTQTANRLEIRLNSDSGLPPSDSEVKPEVRIAKSLYEAVGAHWPRIELQAKLEAEACDDDEPSFRTLRELVVQNLPWPVAKHLLPVLRGKGAKGPFLRQLVLTYETTSQLLCFALLSQFWDEKYDRADMEVRADERAGVEAFLKATAEDQKAFDYIALARLVGGCLERHGIALFMEELSVPLLDPNEGSNFAESCRLMQRIRIQLATVEVGQEDALGDIDRLCREAEDNLCRFFATAACLACYTVATVRTIELVKPRHAEPDYYHNQVVLDRPDPRDMEASRKSFSSAFYSNSVSLRDRRRRDAPKGSLPRHLNLAPFVVDENALTQNVKAKIFFYLHAAPVGNPRCFSFRFMEHPEADPLVVSTEKYPSVKTQFEAFERGVLPR